MIELTLDPNEKGFNLELRLRLASARESASSYRLERIHAPLELAIKESEAEIETERVHATVDELYVAEIIDHEYDQIEELLGLAFASTQVVLTAFRTRIVKISEYCQQHLSKNLGFDRGDKGYGPFHCAPELRPGCGFTDIQAINEVANYWKHKDEWRISDEERDGVRVCVWKSKGHERTIKIVGMLGIKPFSADNLRAATSAIGGGRYDDLSGIRAKVDSWVRKLIEKAEEQL